MADNTTLNPGTGGDTVREVDKAGIKTQVVIIDMGGGGLENVTSVPATQATLAAVLAELLLKAKLTDTQPVSAANLDVALSTRTKPSDQQHVIVDSGSITANAGSNLNTSLLAMESGGNLATIAGKDFATQTTLALVKARTDNIPPVGQALSAASMPVVISSDQTAIPITGSVSATSAATSSSIPPNYNEAVSNALSQTLTGSLRTYDKSFNYEMLSETNDLLRLLIREIWSLRMGFVRELRDMPDPSELDFHNPENTIN